MRGATYLFLSPGLPSGFLLTRLLRGATMLAISPASHFRNFYSHASCEARLHLGFLAGLQINFYSHASCEARPYPPFFEIYFMPFLLTRLLRGATSIARSALGKIKFLLTRLLRGATKLPALSSSWIAISTHTPLARRDCYCVWFRCAGQISTHTPLARRD